MSKHIIILGAGISGLSAAWRLSQSDAKVDILESNATIGGLAGTYHADGYSLDFGPHSFFSEDQRIVDTTLSIFDYEIQPRLRNVKFFYKDKFFDYPLTAQSILFQMGLTSCLQAFFSFLKSKFSKRKSAARDADETVEDWAINNFGEYLRKRS